MSRVVRLCLLLGVLFGLTVSSAVAAPVSPDNGTVNLLTKSITLEYGQAPYRRAVVTGLPNKGYAKVRIGSKQETVTTPARANQLLMSKQYTNKSARVVIPHKDIDVTGKINVRHGLRAWKSSRTKSSITVRGELKPMGRHAVLVKVQKKYLGIWITRQTQTVVTSGGKFVARFTARTYGSGYRARVSVAGDRTNAAKTVLVSLPR